MKLSEIIKTKRLKELKTQEELANELGISRITLNHLENGKYKNISIKLMLSLSKYLKRRPSYIAKHLDIWN